MRAQTTPQRAFLRDLLVAITIYLVLRFAVPSSLDSNMHALVGALVAFIASMVFSRLMPSERR